MATERLVFLSGLQRIMTSRFLTVPDINFLVARLQGESGEVAGGLGWYMHLHS